MVLPLGCYVLPLGYSEIVTFGYFCVVAVSTRSVFSRTLRVHRKPSRRQQFCLVGRWLKPNASFFCNTAAALDQIPVILLFKYCDNVYRYKDRYVYMICCFVFCFFRETPFVCSLQTYYFPSLGQRRRGLWDGDMTQSHTIYTSYSYGNQHTVAFNILAFLYLRLTGSCRCSVEFKSCAEQYIRVSAFFYAFRITAVQQ